MTSPFARTRPIRTLVVDDSATMRAVVTRLLSFDPGISVIGQAADPMQARQLIKDLDPDVITLDIEMPGMNGLDFLEKIMTLRPMPVVMVSTLTTRGAEASLRALELGAFECYAKPANIRVGDDGALAAIVRAAASSRPRPARPAAAPAAPRGVPVNYTPRADALIAIGSSTGGVEALLRVLSAMPATCPPIVIVQHLPSLFTTSFAARLDRSCAPRVVEAESGMVLQQGHVYLAPGGATHVEALGSGRLPRLRLFAGDTVSGHRPSVDVLFRSVARFGAGTLGIILTGMGQDGAHGLLEMRNAGARTIGQDEATSVVYGMPGVAHQIGAVEYQLPLDKIAARALELCRA